MTLYQGLLEELNGLKDEEYSIFHRKLMKNDSINVLGVRVPQLRKLAKKYVSAVDELMAFPDEYYEVTFIKLTAVSLLKYDDFTKYVDKCVALIDNWATCDCFAPKCVAKQQEAFLHYVFTYLEVDKEFYQRFALITLLHYYVEEKYLETIIYTVKRANTKYYYVRMAAAWLIAEVLVKFYDEGVNFLRDNFEGNFIDKYTHNKAIQKALESSRLSNEQKTYLKGLKK